MKFSMKAYYIIELTFGFLISIAICLQEYLTSISNFYKIPTNIFMLIILFMVLFLNGSLKIDFHLSVIQFAIGYIIILVPVSSSGYLCNMLIKK